MPSDTLDLRAGLLQVVVDSAATPLADNLDHLFHPFGHPLPDASQTGARLLEQLDVLDRCEVLSERLGDDDSRNLLLRFLAYRALGPAHVRLQLDPADYRQAVQRLTAELAEQVGVLGLLRCPIEWQFHRYDLSRAGIPVRVIAQPLPLASTFVFSQYAYRDASAGAQPRPGDVALDVGGCWGETALWLAHFVGDAGRVHTFEPAPKNRELLAANLQLNPALEGRISVHGTALAARPGETLWIPDVVAAGAQPQQERVPGDEQSMAAVETQTIDALVASGAIPRVDFVKLDVEGAELDVLEGAAETIARQRPRLAIAIYHKPDDLATIPTFLDSLGVEYRWYLQCSTMTDVDTVAFAVPEPA